MEVKERKTVRFEQLVNSFGKPQQVTLWTKPEEDKDFMKAVQENRVVTLFQRNVGTKKDYGVVGFFREPHTAFLVFERQLSYARETKVIGVKYDQIAPEAPRGPVIRRERSGKKGGKPEKRGKTREREAEEAKPKRFLFRAQAELTAKKRVELTVEAENQREAKQLMEQQLEQVGFDLEQVEVQRKLGKLQQSR